MLVFDFNLEVLTTLSTTGCFLIVPKSISSGCDESISSGCDESPRWDMLLQNALLTFKVKLIFENMLVLFTKEKKISFYFMSLQKKPQLNHWSYWSWPEKPCRKLKNW